MAWYRFRGFDVLESGRSSALETEDELWWRSGEDL